ncbi:MAG: dienelactone hydrolase family protein [Candidatus Eremiobacteraeota bacterium]|nr:dienelactone hydrolase family protein [Candidatus Eremiobacteraeota bacterium]
MGDAIDPTKSTSLEMNRRAFASLSVGAAAMTGLAGASAQAQAQFGRPHPPLVAEDDPSITIEHVQLRRPDATVAAYAAYPATVRANTPGVVVSMHIWGPDAQMRDVVRRFAKAGYCAIVPDLFSRFAAPNGDGSTDVDEFRPFAQKLTRKQYGGDLRAGALHLLSKAPHAKRGVIGFCMGGHLALEQAIDNADVFDAVAPFYGAVKDIDPLEVHIPVCGSYGERDSSIPADDVRTRKNALRVRNDIRIYGTAGHAFFDDTRPAYVAAAAEDAWKRTLIFFKELLELPS